MIRFTMIAILAWILFFILWYVVSYPTTALCTIMESDWYRQYEWHKFEYSKWDNVCIKFTSRNKMRTYIAK